MGVSCRFFILLTVKIQFPLGGGNLFQGNGPEGRGGTGPWDCLAEEESGGWAAEEAGAGLAAAGKAEPGLVERAGISPYGAVVEWAGGRVLSGSGAAAAWISCRACF